MRSPSGCGPSWPLFKLPERAGIRVHPHPQRAYSWSIETNSGCVRYSKELLSRCKQPLLDNAGRLNDLLFGPIFNSTPESVRVQVFAFGGAWQLGSHQTALHLVLVPVSQCVQSGKYSWILSLRWKEKTEQSPTRSNFEEPQLFLSESSGANVWFQDKNWETVVK